MSSSGELPIANAMRYPVVCCNFMKRPLSRSSPKNLSRISKGDRRRLEDLVRKMRAAQEYSAFNALAPIHFHGPYHRIIE
jgi:hypothetical protein